MELYVARLLPSVPPHLFFFVLIACCATLFPCSLCLDAQYEYCQNTSKCGAMNIAYPFGVGKGGCGLPNFQIACVQNSVPVITIHSRNYTVLELSSRRFRIARSENCQLLDDHIKMQIPSSDFSDTVFRITGTENRSLNVYKCNMKQEQLQLSKYNDTVCYALYEKGNSIPGCSLEQVIVDVGLMQWVPSPTDKSCRSCEASGGICGYDDTWGSTKPFVCYCKDGHHADKCPPSSKQDGKNYTTRSIFHSTAGFCIGLSVLISIVVLSSMFYLRNGKSPPSSTSQVEKFLEEYAYQMPMPTRYALSDLKKITNNFAEKLGEGGFGVVYKGMLRNGALVAVKLIDRHRHSETQFMNEVATIGWVHHVNLVRLLGYCFESPTSALVYEYMVNGSLDKLIFPGKQKGQVFRWEQLYSIALGVARGIAYLHQDCNKRIIHFDIKPHNILLDAEFTPKVSDFGLAKLCGKEDDHVSMTVVRGTPGYVAPEVWNRDMGPVTDKSDVYSFGMLLLEIVGGRKNIDVQVSHSSRLYFPEWAFKMLGSEELGMRLEGGEIGEEEMAARRLMTKVGMWCIQYRSTDRPCMSKVVQMLEGNGDHMDNPPFPFNSSTMPEIPLLSSTEKTFSIENIL